MLKYMKINNVEERDHSSSVNIYIETNAVNFSYTSIVDNNLPVKDEFYTVSFDRKEYERGIENLIRSKSCLI